MNKTVLLTVIICIGIIVGVFAFVGNDQTSDHGEVTTSDTHAALQDAVVTIPESGEAVTLHDGEATPSEGGYVMLGTHDVFVTTDHGEDILADFVVNYGGSGVFVYVGLFQEQEGVLHLVASTPIGDRVVLESIDPGEVHDGSYDVTIHYLDRTAEQSMADRPSVPTTQVVTVSGDTMTAQ